MKKILKLIGKIIGGAIVVAGLIIFLFIQFSPQFGEPLILGNSIFPSSNWWSNYQ